jgi:hypothetical protein
MIVRKYYLEMLETLYPDIIIGGIGKTVLVGLFLFVVVSFLNMWVIHRKIAFIWKRKG